MSQKINQFSQKQEAGQEALNAIEGRAIVATVAEDFEGEIKNGEVVALLPTSKFPNIVVVPKTNDNNKTIGVVNFNSVQNKYKAKENMTVFTSGKAVYVNIGEAVNAGDELTWNNDNKVFMKKTDGTVDAIALDKMGVGLGRVIVKGNIF